MAIPKIEKQDIAAAMKYIDEHGVPEKNKSTQYVLVTEDGCKVLNHFTKDIIVVPEK